MHDHRFQKKYTLHFSVANTELYGLYMHWVIPEKFHTPTTEGKLENLTGGGVNSSGNPDGRGALNLKIHPRG